MNKVCEQIRSDRITGNLPPEMCVTKEFDVYMISTNNPHVVYVSGSFSTWIERAHLSIGPGQSISPKDRKIVNMPVSLDRSDNSDIRNFYWKLREIEPEKIYMLADISGYVPPKHDFDDDSDDSDDDPGAFMSSRDRLRQLVKRQTRILEEIEKLLE
eukprot:Gregarina_sp_Poly_1__6494@NODE_3478_length_1067_cov_16_245000_g2206_i0_p1_GENE_NODE_3478_length_1067_cov_16_245000_g2206_i0NODE_3478_length_1067_cov_16_245000_g2206_i0_p1_ORF_typecomplete_len157_score12_57PIP49_N/PF14875_6/0_29_NODE_3478_length_1067_cov_16_245000_g2206_i0364834